MRILVLGGTAFLGRGFVERAIARGHEVTLFNRGKRDAKLFKELETITGDRTEDVSVLGTGRWDAVFDACGYVPRVVGMSVEHCQSWAERYLFISSISVFKNFDVPGQGEDAEISTLADPATEEVTGETYGGLKALCENVVTDAFKERAIVVRPGLIVGPNDYTDRFTYWPVRMARGGTVLVPDVKDQPVQVIDVRDLAAWCVTLLEVRASGTFNATGPQIPYRFEQVMEGCALGTDAELEWVGASFLTEHRIQPWSDLPLALDYSGSSNGLCQIDVSKAISNGLTFRPLGETIADTRAWALSRSKENKLKAGLEPVREAELLRRWHDANAGSLPK